MTSPFSTAFDGVVSPLVAVNGRTVLAMSRGFGAFQSVADQIMREEGLPLVTPEGWYPAVLWVAAFRRIQRDIGTETLMIIGQQIPDTADFPPAIDSAQKALAAIDVAYHLNHRGGEIGVYGYAATGERSADVHCENPYPCAFDGGLVLEMARRFEPSAFLVHDPASCREWGGKHCLFHVSW